MIKIEVAVAKFGQNFKRRGDEVDFNCPRCDRGRNSYNLGVNLRKEVFNCFKCGYAGFLGGEKERGKKVALELAKPVEYKPLWTEDEIKYTYEEEYKKDPHPAFKWLKSRGMSGQRQAYVGTFTVDHVKFRHRVIIPIMEETQMVSYVARDYTGYLDQKAMYPKKDKHEMPCTPSECMYNLNQAALDRGIIIVEGLFDVEAVRNYLRKIKKYTHYTPVALGGVNISEVQIGKILMKRPQRVVVMLDGDTAGRNATLNVFRKLSKRYRGKIETVRTPEDIDPAEMNVKLLDKVLLPVIK